MGCEVIFHFSRKRADRKWDRQWDEWGSKAGERDCSAGRSQPGEKLGQPKGTGHGQESHDQGVQFGSVTQSCPTLRDPVNCSTSGLPVHHHLPESIQTHARRVGVITVWP